VNLVGITKPTRYTKCETASELVAWAARVSNPSNQNNTMTAAGLIRYLITHDHWSPFEMVSLSMEIHTTRDIARQILRHRSFSFQEYSQRYADPTIDLNFIMREARMQDKKSKQASHETDDVALQNLWDKKQKENTVSAKSTYYWATQNGIAKEQARVVLPEGNTESIVIMAGTLRSWGHFCRLRMKWDTQKEHRIVAEQCWEVIADEFPDIAEVVVKLERKEALKTKLLAIFQEAYNIEDNVLEHGRLGYIDNEALITLLQRNKDIL